MAHACFFSPDEHGVTREQRAQAAAQHMNENLHALLYKCAWGDLAAQRALSDAALTIALAGDDDAYLILLEGLVPARMAALQSGDVNDRAVVAAMLSFAAFTAPDIYQAMLSELVGEAIAWAEIIAESDADAADGVSKLLAGCADKENPEALRWAQFFRSQILEAKDDEA